MTGRVFVDEVLRLLGLGGGLLNRDGLLSRLTRRLRRIADRSLHHPRRRRAVARMTQLAPPKAVLFLCDGNICRSPYAAAQGRHLLSPDMAGATRIDSAGLVGPNRSPPQAAIDAASRRGVDISQHRSSLLTADRLRVADLILVMDPAQRGVIRGRFGRTGAKVVVLGDLDPEQCDTRAIPDPMDQSAKVFEETYARIDRCLHVLVRTALGRDR